MTWVATLASRNATGDLAPRSWTGTDPSDPKNAAVKAQQAMSSDKTWASPAGVVYDLSTAWVP